MRNSISTRSSYQLLMLTLLAVWALIPQSQAALDVHDYDDLPYHSDFRILGEYHGFTYNASFKTAPDLVAGGAKHYLWNNETDNFGKSIDSESGVTFDFLGGDFFRLFFVSAPADEITLYGYNSTGVLAAEYNFALPEVGSVVTIGPAELGSFKNLSRLVIGSERADLGDGFGGYGMDSLQFNVIPEPTVAPLVALGLLLTVFRRYPRRSQSTEISAVEMQKPPCVIG